MEWQGDVLLYRAKYIVIEDLEGFPLTFMKKDIKKIMKIKKFQPIV
jgi:hypothetical protein